MLKGGSRLYWTIQIFGWGCVAAYWSYYQITWSNPTLEQVFSVLFPYGMIILYTHTYRNLAHKYGWIYLPLLKLVYVIFLAWISMTLLYVSITFVNALIILGGLDFDTFLGMFTGGIRYSAIWLLAFHFYHISKNRPTVQSETLDKTGRMEEESLVHSAKGLPDQLLIKDGHRLKHIKKEDIIIFESYGNYVKIYTNNATTLSKNSLNAIEKRTNPERFFRANRKELINMDKIKNIERVKNKNIKVLLSNDHEVILSERKSIIFKELMKL